MLPLKEEDILNAYKRVMSRLAGDVSEVLEKVKNNIETEICGADSQSLAEYAEEIVKYQI